jgi:hypothetical protein
VETIDWMILFKKCFYESGKAYPNFGKQPIFPPGFTELPGTWRPMSDDNLPNMVLLLPKI